ncbi:O-succinylbenzoate synthase, partial [Mycolicibacterium porcinum]
MQTLIDFDRAPVFAIPTVEPIGGLTVREGMLLEGPQGWGEFSPSPKPRHPGRRGTAA